MHASNKDNEVTMRLLRSIRDYIDVLDLFDHAMQRDIFSQEIEDNYIETFCKENIVKDETSYLCASDVYKAYIAWCKKNNIDEVCQHHVFAKIFNKKIEAMTLESRAKGVAHRIYLGLSFVKKINKDKRGKSDLGELYRFVKLHLIESPESSYLISFDALYDLYLQWCYNEDNIPYLFHSFSVEVKRIFQKKNIIVADKKIRKTRSNAYIRGYEILSSNLLFLG